MQALILAIMVLFVLSLAFASTLADGVCDLCGGYCPCCKFFDGYSIKIN